MQAQEAYQILGLNPDASETEIKKAFRVKAGEAHPDKNPNDKTAEERFKKINEAYQTLTNPKPEPGINFNPFGGAGFNPFDFDISNWFRQNSNTNRQSNYSNNLEIKTEVPLELAVMGGEHVIKFHYAKICSECKNKQEETCSECMGSGYTQTAAYSNIVIISSSVCAACKGTGHKKACTHCSGIGTMNETEKLKIQIPPVGAEQTVVLRIKEKGNEAYNGKRGDLFIHIKPIIKNNKFHIQGTNLMHSTKVPLHTLLFGGTIEVDLITGEKSNVEVPKNSHAGKTLRIKNAGVRGYNNRPDGDQVISLEIDYPNNLTEELKQELIKAYIKKS